MVSVLSGNRNFEGRISPDVRMNYLASPPLVVAYALAGSMDVDLVNDPLGYGARRAARLPPGHLAVPGRGGRGRSRRRSSRRCSPRPTTRSTTATTAGSTWTSRPGDAYAWDATSTYVRKPPYFDGMSMTPAPLADVRGARVLAKLGDSVTTDHISPAGNIRRDGPAGRWLVDGGRGARPTSTPTAPAGATTRS